MGNKIGIWLCIRIKQIPKPGANIHPAEKSTAIFINFRLIRKAVVHSVDEW